MTVSPSQPQAKPVAAVPSNGPVLAIGSPATAQDGKYQLLITSLETSHRVERHMVDRLLDGGTCIHPDEILDLVLSVL